MKKILMCAIIGAFCFANGFAQSDSSAKKLSWMSTKQFKGRSGFTNIGYSAQSSEMEDLQATYHNKFGLTLNTGKTFFLHKKAIANIVKIGLDWVVFDATYNQYGINEISLPKGFDYNTGTLTSADIKENKMHQVELGMQVGPSVTINPVSDLSVCAYARYAPTYALNCIKQSSNSTSSYTSSQDNGKWTVRHGYASLIVIGGCISYKSFGLGIEERFGSVKFNSLSLDTDVTKLMTNANNAIEKSKSKSTLRGFRAFVSFRF